MYVTGEPQEKGSPVAQDLDKKGPEIPGVGTSEQ